MSEQTGKMEEIAKLSPDEATARLKQLRHKITILEWDSEMNQIHPFRQHQLTELKEEAKLLLEHCVSPQ